MTALVIARNAATKQSSAPRVGRLDAAVAVLEFAAEPQGQGALRGVPAHGARGPAARGPPRSAPLPEPVRRWVRGAGIGRPVVPVARSSAIASSGSPPAIA